ncbi:ABC transporter, permease protein [Hungatella hathewayi DSM 13479]|uniref:ABC transporter, permease protein n=1 Tax=Hungatella hathewayi DSM 13479 TaxID=566550 RepID=D3AJK6_9FIRM|nr:ABC transporter, permease protein [Hungatella hathewayi DSM 13479]
MTKGSLEARKARMGVLFTAPWIIGLLLFYAYPLLSSIYYSFTSYSVLNSGNFVGLENYRELIKDNLFWKSIWNTLYFTVLSVPVNIILGIIIALLLNSKIRFIGLYRTVFFIPTLVPVVATATVWRWLLDSNYGIINSLLNKVGLASIPWLASENWSKLALVMIASWGIGQAIIINLAGLQDISPEYYEAAQIDGAGIFQRVRHITLPLLTPVIFYNVVMGVINALQTFTLPYTLTNGEGTPVNSLTFYVMHLYNNAFGYMRMGYASAMAWILFLIILILTIVIFGTSKKWVHYQE